MTIIGEGSLLSRPMDFFDEVLPQLGVEIASNNGKLTYSDYKDLCSHKILPLMDR